MARRKTSALVRAFIASNAPPYRAPQIADALGIKRTSERAQVRRILSELSQSGELYRISDGVYGKQPPGGKSEFHLIQSEVWKRLLEALADAGHDVIESQSDYSRRQQTSGNRFAPNQPAIFDMYNVVFEANYEEFLTMIEVFDIVKRAMRGFYARSYVRKKPADLPPGFIPIAIPKAGRETYLTVQIGRKINDEFVRIGDIWRIVGSAPWFTYAFSQVEYSAQSFQLKKGSTYDFWFAISIRTRITRNLERYLLNKQ